MYVPLIWSKLINKKLCCLLYPLQYCSNNPFAALEECSETNPSKLPAITICGSCQ